MLQALFFYALTAGQAAQSVEAIRLVPSVVAEFQLGSRELYLMPYEANRDASVKEAFHYVMPATGGQFSAVRTAPPWAATYWTWKSDRNPPGDPSQQIEVLQEQKRAETGVATPMGGDLARGGADTGAAGVSSGAAVNAARGMQMNNVYTLKLKGEIIGEWIDHPIVPGLTFGWGPKGSGLIAFAEKGSGRLVVMDTAGNKQRVDDTKGVVLPAFSEDSSRLAYLENRGRNRFAVVVATLSK
jgi:hypothetical protein